MSKPLDTVQAQQTKKEPAIPKHNVFPSLHTKTGLDSASDLLGAVADFLCFQML